jgi:hypothetical protein
LNNGRAAQRRKKTASEAFNEVSFAESCAVVWVSPVDTNQADQTMKEELVCIAGGKDKNGVTASLAAELWFSCLCLT